ncbi:MAG: DUF2283 domain-containing protein [Patescibacteria group bacterium]
MKSPLQKIEYDKTVDALYVRASKGSVYKTYKLNSRVLFDVDKKGKLIGIEVLDASLPLSLPILKSSRIRSRLPA